MTVIGVSMVRDEEDVLGTVLAHLLAEGVDHLIVADNLSVDGTRAILEGFGDAVTVVDDPELAYRQSEKMSRLARMAYDQGAEWVLPFDADEVWYAVDGTIAEAFARQPEGVDTLACGGWDHIARVESDGPFSPWRRPHTQQLAKVAFRAGPDRIIDMGNHDVSPRCPPEARRVGVLEYRHFQYRSLEQMTRKLRQGRAAYEASDIHPMHGTHWRAGGLKTDAELERDWLALCGEEGLVYDPAPIRVTA